MATDKKITQLGVMTQAGPLDVLPIVNNAGTPVTEQITTTDLFASPQPIGSSNASTGAFTTLQLPTGATISEFSTDGTLAGDSDTAVPTQKAVKAYVDAAIPSFVSDRIEAGDSSVVVSDSTSSLGSIDLTVDSSVVATLTASGLQLASGATINEFSTDTALTDLSDTAVPTERAVRVYVDNQIASLEVQSDKNDYMLPPQEIAQNSIYTLTETAKIRALYDQQLPKTSVTIPAIGILQSVPGDIEDLENGNYAVSATNGVDCFLSILSPDGTTIIDNKVVSDLDSDAYDASELVRLQNGKIAVLYSAASGGLKFRFYDPDGNVLDSTSQHVITTNVVGQYRAARLTNEKFFVVYSDVTDGLTKYIIINEDGTQFIVAQTLHTSTANYIRAATLTNGNIIITYQDSGDNYLYFKIIDPAGIEVVGKTQVSDSACPASPDQPLDLLALPNGNAFITYADNTLNAKFKVFNGYGSQLIGETAYALSGNVHWIAASYLPDGRILSVAYDTSMPLTYYTVLDGYGNTITQWTENTFHHSNLYSVIGKSGKIAVAWTDTTDPNIYVDLYSGLGTKIDGAFELESGQRVESISNDPDLTTSSSTSLVTEYAVKSYVDAQIGNFSSNKIWQGNASVTAYDNTAEQAVVIEAPVTNPGPDSTAVQILYYNSLSGSNWVNSSSMIDGNTGTFARAGYAANTYVQTNDALASFDSTAISLVGDVQTVEMRVWKNTGPGTVTRAELFPRFGGATLGSAINILGGGAGYTSWVDVTADANGPGVGNWTWTDVQNMYSQVESDIGAPGGGPGDFFLVSVVQVRVTTTITGPGVDGKLEVGRFDENGLTLTSGSTANEISNDGTLVDASMTALPTEYAVKTYVDNLAVAALNVQMIYSDTTAVNNDALLVDTTAGIVNISLTPALNAKIIIKKITTDTNTVVVTVPGGLIDGQPSATVDSVNKAFTFISNGTNYYVV